MDHLQLSQLGANYAQIGQFGASIATLVLTGFSVWLSILAMKMSAKKKSKTQSPYCGVRPLSTLRLASTSS
jgi:hypothetical protein